MMIPVNPIIQFRSIALYHLKRCCCLPHIIALDVVLLFVLLVAQGQNYSLDLWTVYSSFATSTGGVYSISGTVGQPNATPPLNGGQFTLTGGFWTIAVAVQTPGAPYLKVALSATNTVVLSWPIAEGAGWVLQKTNALPATPAAWPEIPPPYQTNGPNLQYVEPAAYGTMFYRLCKP